MKPSIKIIGLEKAYNGLSVLSGLNLSLYQGRSYGLMAPSGFGKTTLFRILLGLEQADGGSITGLENYRFAAVFQEDRLCETYSPLDNVMLVTGKALSRQKVSNAMANILPVESLTRPVSTLSGGMKRRTAICRAIMAPSDGIIMDEPFTGLDEDTKQAVVRMILEYAAGKLLLFSTHQEEDLELLGAERIALAEQMPAN